MKKLGLVGAVLCAVALVLAPVSASAKRPSGGGGGTADGTFSCRASALRVTPGGLLAGLQPIELFVANAPGDPCKDDTSGINAAINVSLSGLLNTTLSVTGSVLMSRTDDGQMGVAHTGVANLGISVLGQAIGVSILSSEATAGPCPSTGLQGESSVLSVTLNGTSVIVDPQIGLDLTILGLGVLHLSVDDQIVGTNQITQRALTLSSDLIGEVVVAEAVADVHGQPCSSTPPPPPSGLHGFMTGGGSIDSSVGRVTHGAHLECVASEGPNNLQVNWPGSHFHLESVSTSSCTNDKRIDPGSPASSFDTIQGAGTGRCDGNQGTATAHWKLTDAGEPGRNDRFEITISGACNLSAAGYLTGGNHQAHGRV